MTEMVLLFLPIVISLYELMFVFLLLISSWYLEEILGHPNIQVLL